MRFITQTEHEEEYSAMFFISKFCLLRRDMYSGNHNHKSFRSQRELLAAVRQYLREQKHRDKNQSEFDFDDESHHIALSGLSCAFVPLWGAS